jgi:hypothetical protein
MMKKPSNNSQLPPLTVTRTEEIEEEVLETEVEAELAREREMLDEMRQRSEAAIESMANIRARIEKLKDL